VGHFDYQGYYQRNLPHFQPRGAAIFVTFRLAGSLPSTLIDQWTNERAWLIHLENLNPNHFARVAREFERTWFAKFESVLDGGSCGPLWLRDDRVADQVAESLHYRDEKVYRLDVFSIMPNHVHVVFRPLPMAHAENCETPYYSLASIMHSLKGFTAHECNSLLERQGEFWAHESYDHYIRNNQERQRIVAYVLNNPVKAGYVRDWREWKWNYCRE